MIKRFKLLRSHLPKQATDLPLLQEVKNLEKVPKTKSRRNKRWKTLLNKMMCMNHNRTLQTRKRIKVKEKTRKTVHCTHEGTFGWHWMKVNLYITAKLKSRKRSSRNNWLNHPIRMIIRKQLRSSKIKSSQTRTIQKMKVINKLRLNKIMSCSILTRVLINCSKT